MFFFKLGHWLFWEPPRYSYIWRVDSHSRKNLTMEPKNDGFQKLVGGFNPKWNILVKLDHFPK